jgi:hypothetical protein
VEWRAGEEVKTPLGEERVLEGFVVCQSLEPEVADPDTTQRMFNAEVTVSREGIGDLPEPHVPPRPILVHCLHAVAKRSQSHLVDAPQNRLVVIRDFRAG